MPKSLEDRLAAVLPKGHNFEIYHLSTPPTRTNPLCSAPPGERPDRTFAENHFLGIAIDVNTSEQQASTTTTGGTAAKRADVQTAKQKVLVFALEVFIYTTAYSTTTFVSKADSTGYLHLLGLPRGSPSPIRTVTTAFLEHLIDSRRRQGVQFIVSLFARAQAQYLFPGSSDNKSKHVLDDRGLVRWWCRVLDPLVYSHSLSHMPTPKRGAPADAKPPSWTNVRAYLVVPGLDRYETRAFLPRDGDGAAAAAVGAERWSLGHPLEAISHYSREYDWVPARCLIPRFPDDPKSRFRDELDEEAAKSKLVQMTGQWKSVKTVDQFWDMMAYRQECSSGRLTGFIWVVFDPVQRKREQKQEQEQGLKGVSSSTSVDTSWQDSLADPKQSLRPPSTPQKQQQQQAAVLMTTPMSTTPRKLFQSPHNRKPSSASSSSSPTKLARDEGENRDKAKNARRRKRKQSLRGPIKPRAARVKTHQRNYLLDKPASTAYYHWPEAGRGSRVVDAADYKRATELLMHLNFANLGLAVVSTRRWVCEVGMGENWGRSVIGLMDVIASGAGSSAGAAAESAVNNLSGLVKRKRTDTTVNVLEVRKKVKEAQV